MLPTIHEVELGIAPNRGFAILATGWMGFVFLQLGWFANLFWALGLLFFFKRRYRAAAILAGIAVLLAADSFMLYRTGFPSDSGASLAVTLMYGVYVWWASMWVLAAGALLLWRGERRAEAPAES